MRWSRALALALAAGGGLALAPGAWADPPPVSSRPPAEAGAAPPPAPAPPPAAFQDAFAPGPSLDARLEEIRRRVQAALVYPSIARQRGQQGETLVSFAIGPDRAPRDVRTEVSSGRASLDRAAERAVAAAAPLPFVYGRVQVPVRFSLEDAAAARR